MLAGLIQNRIAVSDAFAAMLGARYDYRNLAENNSKGQIDKY
jgi:hypothetical protein